MQIVVADTHIPHTIVTLVKIVKKHATKYAKMTGLVIATLPKVQFPAMKHIDARFLAILVIQIVYKDITANMQRLHAKLVDGEHAEQVTTIALGQEAVKHQETWGLGHIYVRIPARA